jgi:hypothetical protein
MAPIGVWAHVGVARKHQLHGGGRNRAHRNLVHGLQQFHGTVGFGLGAIDFELLMPVGNTHLQGQLDGAQVFVSRPRTGGDRRGIVGRAEGVVQNHAGCIFLRCGGYRF